MADNGEQEDQQAFPPAFVPAAAPPAHTGSVHLPTFWPHAPQMWFVQAECIFHNKRITDSFDRHCLLIAALPHESLRLVMDLAANPPPVGPYEAVKARLLQAHELTPYKKVELIMSMPSLGARKPSQLMSAMLELCPPNQQQSPFFICCFMQRLPRELRILLSEADTTDLKVFTERADALHGHMQESSAVAAVDSLQLEEEYYVQPVRQGGGARRHPSQPVNPSGGQKKKQGTEQLAAGNAAAAKQEPEISRQARLAAGMCLPHWRWGDKARTCIQPCSWSGNAAAGGN